MGPRNALFEMVLLQKCQEYNQALYVCFIMDDVKTILYAKNWNHVIHIMELDNSSKGKQKYCEDVDIFNRRMSP